MQWWNGQAQLLSTSLKRLNQLRIWCIHRTSLVACMGQLLSLHPQRFKESNIPSYQRLMGSHSSQNRQVLTEKQVLWVKMQS
mmetsp:Transcript_1557/g.9587  ORF Transcript_1557/g.9587 Transcript_1557/m.9587 type:complete len:82 (+) Transcript_1557:2118-2363(+)